MSWCKEYLSALSARDLHEQLNKPLFDSYTALADRTAHLSATTPLSPDVAKLTAELGSAQRSRHELEARLALAAANVARLQARAGTDERRLQSLAADKGALATRLRDRDEELRGKAKLLEDVHDEQVALTLQLNVSEEQNAQLRAENKELVDRWMARMGQEAEAMNLASRFS